ncbi:MAG: GMC family oxidoreductase [Gemmatimonadota bacterium]
MKRGPENSNTGGERDRYFARRYALRGDRHGRTGAFECVGGPSVFYGAASLRFRREDFLPDPHIVGAEPALWPFAYRDLAPWYSAAERLLGVVGDEREDPTAPNRRRPLPAPPGPPGPTARLLATAARSMGLHPFRLPVAVTRDRCTMCGRCDGFACSLGAKNDLATAVLPGLIRSGLVLRANTVATRFLWSGDRVLAVEVTDARSGQRSAFESDVFVVAAGSLATPGLLLASGLAVRNPAGQWIGRGLMRHVNAVVAGLFDEPVGAAGQFQKEIGVHDYYLGDAGAPPGRLGSVQQIDAGSAALARVGAVRLARRPAEDLARRLAGLIVIAEDQPRAANGVTISARRVDRFGAPLTRVRHRHTPRDLHVRAALAQRARAILIAAGARATAFVPVGGFSHALGGVRMGADRRTSPLGPDGRLRGTANLFVTDGSTFPTSAGVNPSLTIAANALRIGAGIAGRSRVALETARAADPAPPTRPVPVRIRV